MDAVQKKNIQRQRRKLVVEQCEREIGGITASWRGGEIRQIARKPCRAPEVGAAWMGAKSESWVNPSYSCWKVLQAELARNCRDGLTELCLTAQGNVAERTHSMLHQNQRLMGLRWHRGSESGRYSTEMSIEEWRSSRLATRVILYPRLANFTSHDASVSRGRFSETSRTDSPRNRTVAVLDESGRRGVRRGR
ncbi:hypothetical protein C8R44DRAFT_741982 [Mycena epipterygia]|nr:hypothetical protein C8R44DRAFT_741982 [Mycena epipterygia]